MPKELIENIINNNIDLAKKLIEKGTNINFTEKVNGYTALMLACQAGNTELVTYLLSKGANIELKDKYGNSALTYACLTGQTEIVNLLLKNGAKVNPEKGTVPLIVAARNGNFEIVQILINNGANVDSKAANGQTAIMQACCGRGNLGKDKVVKILLDAGADIKTKDGNGNTTLDLAIRTVKENPGIKEFEEIVKMLKNR